jgi:hypothetical protein
MGKTLCPLHGKQFIGACCPHVASAVDAGQPLATALVVVTADDSPRGWSWAFAVCEACAADLAAANPDRRADEADLDRLGLDDICGACLWANGGPEPTGPAVYRWRDAG